MKTTFGIILAAAAVLSAGNVLAGNIYVGGALTHTSSEINFQPGPTVNPRNTVGGNVNAGFNFTEWLAVEASYDYFGKRALAKGYEDQHAQAYTGWVVVDPTIATLGSMPLKVTGRVGYAYTKMSVNNNGNENDTNLAYGAGLALGVASNIDVILDYRYHQINKKAGDVDFDTVNLGVKYTF